MKKASTKKGKSEIHSAEASCGWCGFWQSSREMIWHPVLLPEPEPSTSDCLQPRAQPHSKLGQAATGLCSDSLLLLPAGKGWKEKAGPCVSLIQHLLWVRVMAGSSTAIRWRALMGTHCLQPCSCPGSQVLTSAAAVFLHPPELHWKKKNTAKNRLPCTLFCSQGEKKKKDAILSLCKYNTSNFFSSIAQVKIGNRYVHRKNKHLQVPLKGRNERATAAGVITVAEGVGFMCWGKRLTNREEWTAFRENATGSIVLFQKPIKWAVLGRYKYLGAGAVPQNNHTRKLFYWVPSDSHSRNRILCLKQKPASQLRKAASVLILFFAPRGRNLQQGRMRICNKRETGRSPVGSDS